MSLQVRNLDYQIGGKSILEQICLEVKDGEFQLTFRTFKRRKANERKQDIVCAC